MIGCEIDALTLGDGSAVSSNFVRVALPPEVAVNRWIRAVVTGLDQDGVHAKTIDRKMRS
jgi:hypothetical protein